MCVVKTDRTCADSDKRSVSAPSEYCGAGFESEFFCRCFGQSAGFVGRFNNACKMFVLNAYHVDDRHSPVMPAVPYIVKKSAESRVRGHNEITGHSGDKSFFNVKPFVSFCENFGFMSLDPFVFPNGVFYGG